MALTNEEILNAVAEKTVLELVELISAFEEKFNVSAAAVAVAAAPGYVFVVGIGRGNACCKLFGCFNCQTEGAFVEAYAGNIYRVFPCRL